MSWGTCGRDATADVEPGRVQVRVPLQRCWDRGQLRRLHQLGLYASPLLVLVE